MIDEPAPRIIELPLHHWSVQVHHFDQIDSTSSWLKRYAQQHHNQPLAGIAALADSQTAGRGRMNRQWHSPASGGFYFSLILQPTIDVATIPLITLMTALAAADAVRANGINQLDIKWPNDLLVAKRKLAGILSEATFEGDRLCYLILGIGVNLNQRQFPAELSQATSIWQQTNQPVASDKFLLDLLNQLDYWYGRLLIAPAEIVSEWSARSSFANNRAIQVYYDNQLVSAITCGLTSRGALIARTADNQLITLYGQEITAQGE